MLTCPDQATITPVGSALTNPHTRQPLGRRNGAAVVVRAQVELSRDRVEKTSDEVIDRSAQGEILFEAPPLTPAGADAGYTPAEGDRLDSVTHHQTGASEALGLYLRDCKADGAGGLIRCTLVDRQPERRAA